MSIPADRGQLISGVREAFEHARPRRSLAAAAGVEVEVDAEGRLVALRIDPESYVDIPADDLGRAIVAAHRQARAEAGAGARVLAERLLVACGIELPGAT